MLYLKDPEPEVRSAVLSKLHDFIRYISETKFINSLFPILQDNISCDNNHHVRSLFASCIMKCCKHFNENLFEKYFQNLLNKILKDDVFDVRNSALKQFDELIVFFKNEKIMINILLPAFMELSKDIKWRIRLSIAEKLSNFADKCSKDIFLSYFLPFVNNLFIDHANEIRETTYAIYYKICKHDSNFITTNMWQLQQNALNSNNYIIRISALNSIDYLKEFYSEEFMFNTVIPTILLIQNDKVANVKFCLCNLFKSLFQFLQNYKHNVGFRDKYTSVLQEVINLLQKYEQNDIDIDVRYFAKESLNVLNVLREN